MMHRSKRAERFRAKALCEGDGADDAAKLSEKCEMMSSFA